MPRSQRCATRFRQGRVRTIAGLPINAVHAACDANIATEQVIVYPLSGDADILPARCRCYVYAQNRCLLAGESVMDTAKIFKNGTEPGRPVAERVSVSQRQSVLETHGKCSRAYS